MVGATRRVAPTMDIIYTALVDGLETSHTPARTGRKDHWIKNEISKLDRVPKNKRGAY